MKSYLVGFGLIAALIVSGCASNNNALQAKIDQLETQAKVQDQKIADLKKQEEPTQDKVVDGAKTAWDWTVAHSEAAWNSDTAVDARARLKACYEDLKKSGSK